MSSEALGNKRRIRTPDVPNATDPDSENTSRSDEYLRMLEEDIQGEYCEVQESEVDIALEAGGREGEGVTRGQESPPHQVISVGVARLFRLLLRSRPRFNDW